MKVHPPRRERKHFFQEKGYALLLIPQLKTGPKGPAVIRNLKKMT